MKGERFPLPRDRSTKIGRASRGVNLSLDDYASLDHAEIVPKGERFFINDLKSHTGTVVNGKRLGEDAVEFGVGAVVEVGQTVLQLVEIKPVNWAFGLVLALGIPIVITVVLLAVAAVQPIEYDPVLVAPQPVRQRVRTSEVVPISIDFVRDHGVDHRGLVLKRVTDFDGDGVDELWLAIPGRDLVVTFSDRGEWQSLGELPPDCQERTALDFPDQMCSGLVYQFQGGRYVQGRVEGVITWVRPWVTLAGGVEGEPPRMGPGRLEPYQMTLQYPERLRGFLEARGVKEPIHYLLCEETIAGMRAQVLTVGGDLKTLDYGCLGALRLVGTSSADPLGAEKPQAFAFTVTGFEALVDDITTFLSGSPEGMFLDDFSRALLQSFEARPQNRPGVRVMFLADAEEGPPIAPEEEMVGLRLLARSGVAAPVPPTEVAFSVRTAGRATRDVPGCSELEISTRAWNCKLVRWCLPGRDFVTVRQIGCGESRVLAQIPYRGGYVIGGDSHVDVAIAVESGGGSGQIDVLRTRVAYRIKDAPAP